MSMTRLELFDNLGYKRDPFKDHSFETGDTHRVRRILKIAVESHAMVSIVGDRGVGKTAAVTLALGKIGARVVKVHKMDKGAVKIADIERALILDLSQDFPRGNGEVRSRQLRRIIGELGKKRKVVLLLEEAQRLHGATLKSLKTLREIDWWGETELFSIVLVGQSDPMAKVGLSEVSLRSDCVRMHGLTREESAGYVTATVGKHFEDSAIEAMSGLPQAANFLELQELCVVVLNHALAAGRDKATVEDVRATTAEKELPLPLAGSRKVPATVPTGTALKSVLRRKRVSTQTVRGKEAVAC